MDDESSWYLYLLCLIPHSSRFQNSYMFWTRTGVPLKSEHLCIRVKYLLVLKSIFYIYGISTPTKPEPPTIS